MINSARKTFRNGGMGLESPCVLAVNARLHQALFIVITPFLRRGGRRESSQERGLALAQSMPTASAASPHDRSPCVLPIAGTGETACSKQGHAPFPAIVKRSGKRLHGKRRTVVRREERAALPLLAPCPLTPIPSPALHPTIRIHRYNKML